MVEISPSSPSLPPSTQPGLTLPQPSTRLVQPVGVYCLHGLALQGDHLLAIDPSRGYLVAIDPVTDNARILNPNHTAEFLDSTGLALWGHHLWVTRQHDVLVYDLATFACRHFATLPYPADGVAVWESTVYVSCKKGNSIFIFDRQSGERITRFSSPGIGVENLSVWGEYLWVSDQTEQTIFCLDRATGEIVLSALTPFASPSGLAVPPGTTPDQGWLWVAYAFEEPYIRDNPNVPEDPFQLTFRDRTFIHPLQFRYDRAGHYVLTNGFEVDMAYVEEIAPLDPVELYQLEWRITLPTNTHRQTVKHIAPVGLPFTEEIVNGQRVARFQLDTLKPHESHLLGWRARLEMHGIKYQLTPSHTEDCPPLPVDFRERYLLDDDELAMDNAVVQRAAKAAVGSETNLLRQVLSIRNYVYDRLSYSIRPSIETPDLVLARGTGSCGEYVGLLLALCRINGIACRTVGRYKCPPQADKPGIVLEPDFNHVWLEFYVPGFGWLPMESNVDDIQEGGPYPTRFFMGLPWYHVEMGRDIPFERITSTPPNPEVKLGDLAINHVRFKIHRELGLGEGADQGISVG